MVLAARRLPSIKEHLSRFSSNPKLKNYWDVEAERCLLVIGKKTEDVTDSLGILNGAKEHQDVEIVGLVPSPGFCSHTIYVFVDSKLLSFDIPVDFVPRTIDFDDSKNPIRSISRLAKFVSTDESKKVGSTSII